MGFAIFFKIEDVFRTFGGRAQTEIFKTFG